MKLTATSKWAKLDWGIIVCSAILILISLATLYSLELNQASPDYALLKHQALAAVIGAGLLIFLVFIDFRFFKDYAYFLYLLGCLMLVLVLIFGVKINNTTGWFSIANFTFQPVELFKIILIIALAKFYSSVRDVNDPWTLIKAVSFLVIPIVLVYLQPDLGSLIVLIVIWFSMLFVMKLRSLYIIFAIAGVIITSVFAWQFMLAPYQKERVSSFWSSFVNPATASYHVQQSRIAIGSGRLWGRGLGLGTQSSLNFLPEQETDFIFAVISESLGFLGGSLVIVIYAFLLFRILNLTKKMKDEFATLLAVGIFSWFAFQGLANIAMNLGLAPVFGVPLPFLSYGGSSLLVGMIAIGLLESASLYSLWETEK